MKKRFAIAFALVILIALMAVGVAFAQDEFPPYGGRGPGNGMAWMHEYMEAAMAEAVGLPVTEFEARRYAGETFYQIALAEGFAAEEFPALMQAARDKALDAAVADGAITQQQADWMKSRGFGRGGMMGGYDGYRQGACPMYNGDGGSSGRFGPGMMNGWGGSRWQQAPPPQGSQY